MVTTIKKGASKKEINSLLEAHRKKSKAGIDIKKFCGALKLMEDPLELQKKWRDEWE
jgi:hypothetical protein